MTDKKTGQTEKKSSKRHHWAIDVVLAFLLVLGFHAWQTRNLAHGPAPKLSGLMLDGSRSSLESFRGRPVLVHFWATWCPVCKTEQGSIQSLSEDYPMISVAYRSGSAAEVQKYMQQHQLDFPVMMDEQGMLGMNWGVQGVPSSFIVDAQGQIRSVAVGYTTEPGLRLRMWLAGF